MYHPTKPFMVGAAGAYLFSTVAAVALAPEDTKRDLISLAALNASTTGIDSVAVGIAALDPTTDALYTAEPPRRPTVVAKSS